tara:strand:- start:4437 stop:4703 length:267 start_codon:yes stop_codon:yes gene_type:complete
MKLTKFFQKILSNKSQTTKPYQSLAWASTCTIVTGACLASLIPEYYIHHYFFILGSALWIITGYLWKENSLLYFNIMLLLIYIVGLIV